MSIKRKTRLSDFVIALVLVVISLSCVLPLVYELALSLSSNEAVVARQVGLVPVDFTWRSYQEVFRDGTVLQALWFSVWSTALFTAVAMFLTITAAYPLTRPEFRGRKTVTTLIIVTMYFSGGILPLYILIKSLGMLNTVWAIVLPLALSPFNLIILKTSIAGIPDSMTEAALMDGATYWQILLKVILPLSAPILATLSLFYAVGRWNTFQDALFYLTKSDMMTLQLKLANMVMNSQAETFMNEGAAVGATIVPAALTAATVIVATVPILVIYPWLQRYFISGVMVGGVKE